MLGDHPVGERHVSSAEEASTAASPATSKGVVAPHAPLDRYYGEEARRHRYVVDLFNRSAPHYNTIERIFGNVGLWYRRFSLRRAGMSRGMRVLDVAIGTAAVARGARRLVGAEGRVFGVDPSIGMIREARRVFHGPVVRGIATELPFASESFDFVTMGIALRHVRRSQAPPSASTTGCSSPAARCGSSKPTSPRRGSGTSTPASCGRRVIPGLTLALHAQLATPSS